MLAGLQPEADMRPSAGRLQLDLVAQIGKLLQAAQLRAYNVTYPVPCFA